LTLRIFIISLSVLLKSGAVQSQQGLNDSLLACEYSYFTSSSDPVKQQVLLKKVSLYLSHNITGPEVLNEIRRVNTEAIASPQQKENFLWNAALIAYLNNETARAGLYLDRYEKHSGDTSLSYNLLLILVNKYTDSALVTKKINQSAAQDSAFKSLACFAGITNYSRKHRNFYLLSSAILPGSGAIMNGYVIKGAVSLALAAGSVYGIVKMVEYGLYINAVLWGTGVGLKFYTGNIRLTENLFYKAEARQKNKLATACELNLKTLLTKYPVNLRDL
jgi:hypothetical protein